MTVSGSTDAADVYESLLRLRIPMDLDLSPDGRRVAFVLANESGNGARVSLAELDGDLPPRVLSSPEAANARYPRWNALGDVLVFADNDDVTSTSSLVAMDPTSGACLWRQSCPGFIEDIVVSGNHIVARFADPGSEQDGMHWGRRLAEGDDPWVSWPEKRWRRLAVTDFAASQLHVVDLHGWTVWDFDVNPEGDILAVASRDPLPSGYYQPVLVLTNVVGKEPRSLWDGDQRQLSRPRLPTEGGDYAFVLRGVSIVSGKVYRVDLTDGEPEEVAGLDDVTDMHALPGGRLWFCGWTESGVQLGILGANGELECRFETDGLLNGRDGQPSIVVDWRNSRAVGVWENWARPPEISVASFGSGAWQQITTVNGAAPDVSSLLEREWIRWVSVGGVEILGLLIFPKTRVGTLPLVTILHGGPTWLVPDAFFPAESSGLALPLALAGAAVLMPNPRGSSGRGQAFAEAVIGHTGDVDLKDVIAGVDALIDRGIADPERVAVMGLSYGGFLSAWALTQTNRFKTGVVMSGVADWLSFSQSSNIGRSFTSLYHTGAGESPEDVRFRLLERSPAHWAEHATAPLLIIHGEEDRVTPVGQAEQLYGAWSEAGNFAEIVVYPREGHELAEPEHSRDVWRKVLAWFEGQGIIQRTGIE